MWSNHGHKGSWFDLDLAHHGVYEATGWVCLQIAETSPFLVEIISLHCGEGWTLRVVCGCKQVPSKLPEYATQPCKSFAIGFRSTPHCQKINRRRQPSP